MKRPHVYSAGIILVLILLNLLVYHSAVHFDFVHFDDNDYASDNPWVQQGLNKETITWALTHQWAGYWIPLTWFSFMIDRSLFGFSAASFHAMNIFWHIANTVLLFILLKKMTGSLWRSGCVATLFAIHPLHVESVVWITERKDVLNTFFWFLSIGAYVHYAKTNDKKYYFGMIALWVLSLMAKATSITHPFLLLLLDYWPLQRVSGKKNFQRWLVLAKEKIPLILVAIVFSVITCFTQQSEHALGNFGQYSIYARITNALVSYVKYMELMFWPAGLSIFYPHPQDSISLFYALVSRFIGSNDWIDSSWRTCHGRSVYLRSADGSFYCFGLGWGHHNRYVYGTKKTLCLYGCLISCRTFCGLGSTASFLLEGHGYCF